MDRAVNALVSANMIYNVLMNESSYERIHYTKQRTSKAWVPVNTGLREKHLVLIFLILRLVLPPSAVVTPASVPPCCRVRGRGHAQRKP